MKTDSSKEIFEVVDTAGNVIGRASRAEVHSNPALIHRVVHILIFDRGGRLLLQKRSMNKDIAPGKWDTSVGGHVNPGEDVLDAAKREMNEELAIEGCEPRFLYSYLFRNHRESELVSTFTCIHEGSMTFNQAEIDEIKFWDMQDIRENLGTGLFSNHFEKEFSTFIENRKSDF